MRNRAKCKLCNDILESFHVNDRVECSCGEISITGGQHAFECAYRNISSFIRLDDNGKEIEVKEAGQEGGIEGIEEQLPVEFTLEMIRQCATEDKERDPRRLVTSYDLYCLVEALYHVIKGKI
jgi:hypothetical protein